MDVSTAIVLKTDHTIHQILRDAGDLASEPYRLTPLDFASREEWITTKLWQYNVNILRNLGVVRQRARVRPTPNFSSFTFPKLSRGGSMIALGVALVYSAIFMAAWNFQFPSATERSLWRICTSLTVALTVAVGIVEVIFPSLDDSKDQEPSSMRAEEARKSTSPIIGGCFKGNLLAKVAGKRFNNSLDKDPALDVPLKSILLMQPICALYTLCRIYVLLEDIIGLRALPASTFKYVDWTIYWPHI